MNQRYASIKKTHRSITDSHKGTFDWAFSRNGPGFVEWLESDASLYWINGKAGSGKSTLMKFIAEDSKLKKHLKVQDPSLDLLCAKFFF
jgi:predicted ATPase